MMTVRRQSPFVTTFRMRWLRASTWLRSMDTTSVTRRAVWKKSCTSATLRSFSFFGAVAPTVSTSRSISSSDTGSRVCSTTLARSTDAAGFFVTISSRSAHEKKVRSAESWTFRRAADPAASRNRPTSLVVTRDSGAVRSSGSVRLVRNAATVAVSRSRTRLGSASAAGEVLAERLGEGSHS